MGTLIAAPPAATGIERLDWGFAGQALADEEESGDGFLIRKIPDGCLIAMADGLGHGPDAAAATRTALATISLSPASSLEVVFKRCHHELLKSRGVALTLVTLDFSSGVLTWLAVGNVEGLLLRKHPVAGSFRDAVRARAGVVGYQLPPLNAAKTRFAPDDTLILATDGIRFGFVQDLPLGLTPAELARFILVRHGLAYDDALVLVARIKEPGG